MLKPYLDRDSVYLTSDGHTRGFVLALSSAESADGSQVPEELSCAEIPEVLSTGVASDLEDDVELPIAVVQGRLRNPEILSRLDVCFMHLTETQREDVVELIKSNLTLFSDVAPRTNVLKYDIDVGDSTLIK